MPQSLSRKTALLKTRFRSNNFGSVKPVDLVVAMDIISKLLISEPASPGLDFCGSVVAIYPANDTFHVGQKVFGKLDIVSQFG
jgi:hypothetical protein